MICPYCKNEMVKGVIEGDGRSPFRWINDGEKIGLMDRLLCEKNVIAKNHPLGKTSIQGYNCTICNKLIIDIK